MMASNWRELYSAALFETDERRLPERIAQAEKEMIRRARELFFTPSHDLDEEEAIDRALLALRALLDCTEQKYKKTA